MLRIIGYPDRYSVAPGETIAFKLSVEEGDGFDARLVRVVHGDCNPEGPGIKFIHIPTAIDGRHAGRRQRIDAGSFMMVDPMPALAKDAFTFFAMIWPTRPGVADQTILAQWDPQRRAGFRIGISDGGRLSVTLGDGAGAVATISTDQPMLERQWYFIRVAIDPASRRVMLDQRPLQPMPRRRMPAFQWGCPARSLPSMVRSIAGSPESDGSVDAISTARSTGRCSLPDSSGRGPSGAAATRRGRDHRPLGFRQEIPGTRAVDIGPGIMAGWSICRPVA